MLQLIYLSSASDDVEIDLDAIRDQSTRNNRRSEITGLFLLSEGRFLQVLEGPRDTVIDCFLRIVVDPRHHSLMLIGRRMITAREFGVWEMGQRDGLQGQQEMVEQVREAIKNETQQRLDIFNAAFG